MATANARLRILSNFSKVFAGITRLAAGHCMAAPKDKIDGELDICIRSTPSGSLRHVPG